MVKDGRGTTYRASPECFFAPRFTNRRLPDYARVQRWVPARAAFSAASGLATANGRPQREAIRQKHADLFAAPASPSSTGVSMSFYQRLVTETAEARQGLLAAPIVQGTLRGESEQEGGE